MNDIVWYPGHMAKAKRKISECLPMVDAVIELLDARVPRSSQNPDFKKLFASKPTLTLLTKCGLADTKETEKWIATLKKERGNVIAIDCKTGAGISRIEPALRALTREKTEAAAARGKNKTVRAMVVGITNVGKSTFINTFTKTSKARAEDRPGVTRENRWIQAPGNIELLDTPGLLWHKFTDRSVGIKLACVGSVRDRILDTHELTFELLSLLKNRYPECLNSRYNVEATPESDVLELFEAIARRRGFIRAGNVIDEERADAVILDEFRSGKMGKITLD